ncbi:hypothetical protein ADK65_02175 [Streptomyces sp. NRRL B-1140]|uniref:hypothetical protein n=1 Tax=Streptomyces sp. NRRL B-1140 TaxID=1415549 RepID=UPI0006C5C105|nr:hypothetical protein [Streptomyces sp. NRRL B-1140]KOX06051.1 hypothetical protein ADK65_02175 [Streptomyces sp. NRRL B-1140]
MTSPGFRPTHVVPQHGMPAWEAPDPARPTVDLDPLLPVQLLERQGDWGHVLCFNGWSAWVDGRRLVAVPQDPPAADGPLTRTADPRPLLGRAQEALARYRSAVEDLAAGLDRESFRTRTHGLRIGVVVDGESVWLYDSAHGHWVYADGTRMTTYATDETPEAEPASRSAEASVRPPARVVPPETPAPSGDASPEAPQPPAATPPAASEPATGAGPPEAPEPTRVVAAHAAGPTRVVPPERPDPTRVVVPDGPEPTRVVAPDASESAPVVAPDASEPASVVPPDGPEPTRVVAPDAPEPTRVVTVDAPEPTRLVSPEGREGEGEGEPEAERPGVAPPTRVVGQEPTRVVPPEGDGR